MPQNRENAYLVIKNPRAPRALRQALDPSQLGLTLFMRVHCMKSAKRSKIFSLGPPLQKARYGPVSRVQEWVNESAQGTDLQKHLVQLDDAKAQAEQARQYFRQQRHSAIGNAIGGGQGVNTLGDDTRLVLEDEMKFAPNTYRSQKIKKYDGVGINNNVTYRWRDGTTYIVWQHRTTATVASNSTGPVSV